MEFKTEIKETLLTPRFYTTNFKEMSELQVVSNESEIKAVLAEFRNDYNRNHFIRDKEFLYYKDNFSAKTKALFVEFLERSCTAEFSGFLLYKEISRNLKKNSPLLAEGFSFMARDEARHAGFLNKAINDFNVSLDLGFLTKTRKYTFFAPKFIFYATYLSEKIGYWRYITIYRHLEKNSAYRVYPLFKYFESWCQDENRHGDFFAAILKSQKPLLQTRESQLWCKFFLLSVFLTMYINDFERAEFYSLIGLNAKKFDQHVIKKTNQSCKALFPVTLNLDDPNFFLLLDKCVSLTKDLSLLDKIVMPSFLKILAQLIAQIQLAIILMKLYFIPSVSSSSLK